MLQDADSFPSSLELTMPGPATDFQPDNFVLNGNQLEVKTNPEVNIFTIITKCDISHIGF